MNRHQGYSSARVFTPIPKQTLRELVFSVYLSFQESSPASSSLLRMYQNLEKQNRGGMLFPRMAGRISERGRDPESTLKHLQRKCFSPLSWANRGRGHPCPANLPRLFPWTQHFQPHLNFHPSGWMRLDALASEESSVRECCTFWPFNFPRWEKSPLQIKVYFDTQLSTTEGVILAKPRSQTFWFLFIFWQTNLKV